ncbi:hypothetical protein OH76DRAFT_418717 [Lentinus brumalis]|uniref:DUF7918 domain-containing protein n=1 Tax=Lentinus brumalis TaxID=2498619 RepID=A0A371DW78_9APHY|nr:hypothetical protein OH76DRAFT_418717 [Polyporus brumalis]
MRLGCATAVRLQMQREGYLPCRRRKVLRRHWRGARPVLICDHPPPARMHSRGFDVFIRCGEKELEEYDVGEYDEDGQPTIECYIASEAGKQFTICWCEEDPRTDMMVQCYIDGQLVDTTAHFADEGSGVLRGLIISPDRYRPFMFEEVRRTSNPEVSAPGSVDSLFETIVVTLTEVD